jgi:hypothetical protein
MHFVQSTPTDKTICAWYKQFTETERLPRDLADLKAWIIATVKNIDAAMKTRVWQEIEYRIDVCRVTRGARIEHL